MHNFMVRVYNNKLSHMDKEDSDEIIEDVKKFWGYISVSRKEVYFFRNTYHHH